MCRTLFHLPHELLGIPLFGLPSWSVVIWVACCAIALIGVVRQGKWDRVLGNLVSMIAVVGVLGVLLPRMEEAVGDQVLGIAIRGYGVMMLIAVVTGIATALYRARQVRLDQEALLTLAMWMFVSGILGARIFFVVQKWEQFVDASPFEMVVGILNLAEGGLVVYGAFIGAMVGLCLCLRRLKLPILPICDMISASMLFGLAIGRIGCLMNGCCYGGMSDHNWAVTFPADSPPYMEQLQQGMMHGFTWDVNERAEVVVDQVTEGSAADAAGLRAGNIITAVNGHEIRASLSTTMDVPQRRDLARHEMERRLLDAGEVIQVEVNGTERLAWDVRPWPTRSFPVHPTQIYSATNALCLGLLLWYFYPLRSRDGQVFGLLLTLYPVTRFLLEIIRIDEGSFAGTGLSISQNVSLLLGVVGLAVIAYVHWRPTTKLWYPVGATTS